MTKKEFNKLFSDRIIVLDGGMGTLLQKLGMPDDVCPEKWAVMNPDILRACHKKYRQMGSDIIYSFTFGANPIKLSEYGLSDEAYILNKALAEIAREAIGSNGLVAGDISSCGSLLEPYGNITFEEAVDCFKIQVRGLIDGGVDLFIIETVMDIQEARAALIAVKELCDLPVMATMTFESPERTLMGNDPLSVLVTLQSLGADAVGCNCSSGPAEMIEIISKIKPYAKVPLIAKPNAGKPRLENGKTVFDMDADSFSAFAIPLVEAGVNCLGGCCGTTPEYIRKVAEKVKEITPIGAESKTYSLACSNRKTVAIHHTLPFAVIGERLNPTGKKALKEALIKNDMDFVSDLAREQVESGAELLDINAGIPEINEKETLKAMINAVCDAVSAPVLIDTSNPEALEAALRIYPGRAIINSISGESEKLDKFLPLAKKYGAMFILLPLDDSGVPETAKGRIEVIKKVYSKARKMGFSKEDILVDGLVMTIASNSQGAKETLKVIEWCRKRYKVNTTLGLSNISFGLPAREYINASFLSMAVLYGLSSAILNPNNEQVMYALRASEALIAKDKNALKYVKYFTDRKLNHSPDINGKINLKTLHDAILYGARDTIEELIKSEFDKGKSAREIIDNELIPAIKKVGDLYEKKEYFLPQLIRSAETMERAVRILSPKLIEKQDEKSNNYGTIVIATVKGDVHDIGKNIVALLLRNYGFNVIDLGKDVEASCIIEAAKANNADIIALSALMTTTMIRMPQVMSLLKKEDLDCLMMVGGAVLDESYAKSFGAYYSQDAYKAVKLAQKLINMKSKGVLEWKDF
jgi:5-methyltetrahydrofolate--homocysteine methyltransferase